MFQRRRETRTPQYAALDYSISISDVMSALLFVFIVILIMFSFNMDNSESNYRSEFIRVSEERERLSKLNTENEKKLKKLETSVAELRDLASNVKHDVDMQIANTARLLQQLLTDIQRDLQTKENLRVFIDPSHGILRLPDEILFPLGSAQFSPGGEENLKKLARVLERHLPCYSGSADDAALRPPPFCHEEQWNPGTLDAVFIEGHTDNIPLSKANPHANNLHLSGMRAIKTFEALLTTAGQLSNLAELRNQNGQLVFGISGYGEYRPVIPHASPVSEPANRRIDIRFFLVNPKPSAVIPGVFEALDGLTHKLDDLK